ncbi:MAG TPA: HD domain-containing protein [Anaerolineae bacterium]|nr:HD domain-containing protein [Anaerolineae bacterium]HIP73745.1 HD domain-containing protein [Anaerolineae bacterium]
MSKKKAKKKVPWRTAVQEVMLKAAKREATRRYGIPNPPFNYRWEHVTTIVVLAAKLAEMTGADRDVVEAAAWLHDICKDAGNDHPREGAKFAREFLPKTDFPSKKIERVAQAIENHMGLWRDEPLTNLESQVLWDADKLSKIGLTAVFHWIGNDLSKGKPRATADFIRRGRAADWQKKTVASMHTKPARKAAKARLKAFNRLWDELDAELNGDDLG